MKVLFDNCTSPVLAWTLDGFIRGDGHSAHHIREMPLEHPTDLEWMEYLRQSGDAWIVVTGDGRLHRNPAERVAFRRARLKGVVLAPAYQKSPINKVCAALIHQWPSLMDTLTRFDPPVLVEMSINMSGRFKQLSV